MLCPNPVWDYIIVQLELTPKQETMEHLNTSYVKVQPRGGIVDKPTTANLNTSYVKVQQSIK
ncbi:hypothetical protein [Clostridium felsineum]|uniref:hypothetical protein n=1 Tax=Clostridium felsineum TaxID=36839 RepID=UPI004032F504